MTRLAVVVAGSVGICSSSYSGEAEVWLMSYLYSSESESIIVTVPSGVEAEAYVSVFLDSDNHSSSAFAEVSGPDIDMSVHACGSGAADDYDSVA